MLRLQVLISSNPVGPKSVPAPAIMGFVEEKVFKIQSDKKINKGQVKPGYLIRSN